MGQADWFFEKWGAPSPLPSPAGGRGSEDGGARKVPPTLEDAQALTLQSDFSAFAGKEVLPEVRNAAMKRLFADPHFNVMDGLDTYIDDYAKPNPIPLRMLKQLAVSHVLKLFEEEENPHALDNPDASDVNPALRLQPNDAVANDTDSRSRPEPKSEPEDTHQPVPPRGE